MRTVDDAKRFLKPWLYPLAPPVNEGFSQQSSDDESSDDGSDTEQEIVGARVTPPRARAGEVENSGDSDYVYEDDDEEEEEEEEESDEVPETEFV